MMALNVLAPADWIAAPERCVWTFGSLTAFAFVLSFYWWLRQEPPKRFEPWAVTGLLALAICGLMIGVETFVTPRAHRHRWWRWPAILLPTIWLLDWVLPLLLGAIIAALFGLALMIVFDHHDS